MKRTARKSQFTGRPEIMNFINHHEGTELEQNYHNFHQSSAGYHPREHNSFRHGHRGRQQEGGWHVNKSQNRSRHFDPEMENRNRYGWHSEENFHLSNSEAMRDYEYDRNNRNRPGNRQRFDDRANYDYGNYEYSKVGLKEGYRRSDSHEKNRDRHASRDRSRSLHREESSHRKNKGKHSRHESNYRKHQKPNGSSDYSEQHLRKRSSSRESRRRSRSHDSKKKNEMTKTNSKFTETASEISQSSQDGSPVRSWKNERNTKHSVKISEIVKTKNEQKIRQSGSDDLNIAINENDTIDDDTKNEKSDDEILSMSSTEMRSDGTSPYTNGDGNEVSVEIRQTVISKEDKEDNGKTKLEEGLVKDVYKYDTSVALKDTRKEKANSVDTTKDTELLCARNKLEYKKKTTNYEIESSKRECESENCEEATEKNTNYEVESSKRECESENYEGATEKNASNVNCSKNISEKNEDTRVVRSLSNDKLNKSAESKNTITSNIDKSNSNASVGSKQEVSNYDVVGRILQDKNYSSISSKNTVKYGKKSQDFSEKKVGNISSETVNTKLKPDKGKSLGTGDSCNSNMQGVNSKVCSESPTKCLNTSFLVSNTKINQSKRAYVCKNEQGKTEFKQSEREEHISSDTSIDRTSERENSLKPKQSKIDDGQSGSSIEKTRNHFEEDSHSGRQRSIKLTSSESDNRIDGSFLGQIMNKGGKVVKPKTERRGSKDNESLNNGGKTNEKNASKSCSLTSTSSTDVCKDVKSECKQSDQKKNIGSDSRIDTTADIGNPSKPKQSKDYGRQRQSVSSVNRTNGETYSDRQISLIPSDLPNSDKNVDCDLVGQIIKEGEQVNVKTRKESCRSKDSELLKTGEKPNDGKNRSKSSFLTSTPSKSFLKSDRIDKGNMKIAEEFPPTREERKNHNNRERIHDKDLTVVNETLFGNDIGGSEEMPSFQLVCLDKSQTVSERVHKYEKTIDKGKTREVLFNKHRRRKSHVPETVTSSKQYKDLYQDKKVVSKLNDSDYSSGSKNTPTRTNIFESLGSQLGKNTDENNTKSPKDTTQAKETGNDLKTEIVHEGKLPVDRAAKLDLTDKVLKQTCLSGEECQKKNVKHDKKAKTETVRNEGPENLEDVRVERSKPISCSGEEPQEKTSNQTKNCNVTGRDEKLLADRAGDIKSLKDRNVVLTNHSDTRNKKMAMFNQNKTETPIEDRLSFSINKTLEEKTKKSERNKSGLEFCHKTSNSVIDKETEKENCINKLSVARAENSKDDRKTPELTVKSAGSEKTNYVGNNETKTVCVSSNSSLSVERTECSKDTSTHSEIGGQKESVSIALRNTEPENKMEEDKVFGVIVESSRNVKDHSQLITQCEAKLQMKSFSNQTPKLLPHEDGKPGNTENSVSQNEINVNKKEENNQIVNKTISSASHSNLPPVLSSVTNIYSKTERKTKIKRNSTDTTIKVCHEFPARTCVDAPQGIHNPCETQTTEDVSSRRESEKDIQINDSCQTATYINDEDLDEDDFCLIDINPYTPHPNTGQVENRNEADYSDISDAETERDIRKNTCQFSMKYLDDRVFVGTSDKNVYAVSDNAVSSEQVENHKARVVSSKDVKENTSKMANYFDETEESDTNGETNLKSKRKNSLNGSDLEEMEVQRKKLKINDETPELLHNSEMSNDTESHTPAKSAALKDDSVRKHLKYMPESPLKTPKKTNYGKRLANASKGFDEPACPEITSVDSCMKKKCNDAGKLKRKHCKETIKSGPAFEGVKTETPPKKKKTEKPNYNVTPTNRRNKMKKDLETAKMTIKVPTHGDKKDKRCTEQLKKSNSNFDVESSSCDTNENEQDEELDKPPVHLRSGSLESTAPVLINGFDIIHTLTLKDSKRVTTSGHLDPQKLNAGERCIKCEICSNYFSPLEFTSHHDSGDIIPKIDFESSMRNSFDAKLPNILHWNENASKIWEKFKELFEKEKRLVVPVCIF